MQTQNTPTENSRQSEQKDKGEGIANPQGKYLTSSAIEVRAET